MSDRHVVIVGGGLVGLTAANELARRRIAVTLLEGSGQLGGRARSTVRDGTIRNLGPHGLALQGPGTAILEELGIELPELLSVRHPRTGRTGHELLVHRRQRREGLA